MNSELMTALGELATVILGFIIFFNILKRFAWGPILDLLDERQRQIQSSFDEAKSLQEDAEKAHEAYEAKLREIEAEARTKITEAVNEGKRVAAELTEKARVEAADMVEKARKSIELETASARKELREDVIRLTLQASEQLLMKKLDAGADKELVGSILSGLEGKSL